MDLPGGGVRGSGGSSRRRLNRRHLAPSSFHTNLEGLRALARCSAAQPFVIRLTDGRAIMISHPEFLGIPRDGQSFLIFPETGARQFVFLN